MATWCDDRNATGDSIAGNDWRRLWKTVSTDWVIGSTVVIAAIVALISSNVLTPMRCAGGRSDSVSTSGGSSVRA